MADRNTRIRASQLFDGGVKFEDLSDEVKVSTIAFIIDGGGQVINTGVVGDIKLPFSCDIEEVTLLADQTGSIVVDIYKDTYANYPPTTSITASAKPTLSSSIKMNDTTLTSWTKNISEAETLRFNVDSCSTITRCLISLKIKRL